MKTDGTIILRLRAVPSPGGAGGGTIEYPLDHPQYRSILEHLGGLNPGERKPVPPWD